MAAATAELRAEQDGRGIARLTFDRPHKGNAYDEAMLAAMAARLTAWEADPSVRLVVLAGAGRHFCAGGDLSPKPADAAHDSTGPALSAVCLQLDRLAKPTLALVHGACLGGGLAFAACCDIVVATDDAFFSLPEVRLGFPAGALVPFLAASMGARPLRRYLLTGARFDAATAHRIGLVHALCAADGLEAAAERIVAEVLEAAPKAAAANKAFLRDLAGAEPTPERLAGLEADFRRAVAEPEAVEGRAAFREKRPPAWAPPRP